MFRLVLRLFAALCGTPEDTTRPQMSVLEACVLRGRPLFNAARGFVGCFSSLRSQPHRWRRQQQRRHQSTHETADNAPVVFSGIQPTGVPHLGNYLGAMRQWKQLQNSAPEGAKLLFSIVDLHAITMPQDGSVLMQRKREMLAALIAIGLNPNRSILFYQSSVCSQSTLS